MVNSDYKKTTIESYDKTVDDYIKKTDKMHPAEEAKRFLSMLPAVARILDLGCGPGRDAKIFAGKGHEVTGVDLSKNMVAVAKARVKNAKFMVMDILDLKFKPECFEGVWASASIIHIPKTRTSNAIGEVYRVLKKGGVFYLAVKEGKGEEFVPDERYNGKMKFWSLFQKAEIEEAVKKTGFKIIKSYVSITPHKYSTHPWISVFARKD